MFGILHTNTGSRLWRPSSFPRSDLHSLRLSRGGPSQPLCSQPAIVCVLLRRYIYTYYPYTRVRHSRLEIFENQNLIFSSNSPHTNSFTMALPPEAPMPHLEPIFGSTHNTFPEPPAQRSTSLTHTQKRGPWRRRLWIKSQTMNAGESRAAGSGHFGFRELKANHGRSTGELSLKGSHGCGILSGHSKTIQSIHTSCLARWWLGEEERKGKRSERKQ